MAWLHMTHHHIGLALSAYFAIMTSYTTSNVHATDMAMLAHG